MSYQLSRSPGTCCPEPGCDYSDFKFDRCPNCTGVCETCIKNPDKQVVEG